MPNIKVSFSHAQVLGLKGTRPNTLLILNPLHADSMLSLSFSRAQVWDQKYKTEQAAHFMNLLRPDVMVRKNIDLPWSWGLFSNDPNIPWDIIAAKVHYHVGWKLLMVLNYTSCVHNQVVCT
jgi:hypothetical protein